MNRKSYFKTVDQGPAAIDQSPVAIGAYTVALAGTTAKFTGAKEVTGITIAVTDGAVPAKADHIQIQGKWYAIEQVRLISPDVPGLLYEIEVA